MDPVTIARAGLSDFDEPHRAPEPPAPPAPASLPQIDQAAHAAALAELGRIVVEIRLLERLAVEHQRAADLFARSREAERFHDSVRARDRVNATIAGRRTVLAELAESVANRTVLVVD